VSEQGNADQGDLLCRIERLEARLEGFSDAARVTEECLKLLARARVELAAGHLADAHDAVLRAECLLSRTERSSATVRRWGPAICLYEVALLVGLLLLALQGDQWLPRWLGEQPTSWMAIAPYCLWGALGGVVAGLFGFYLHAAGRDFDRAYVAYYFLKPIVGLVLGPLVYLLARAGLVAVQADGRAIERPELLYLGAFVLGFGERYSLRLIDRVAGAIFGPTEAAAQPEPTSTSLATGPPPSAPVTTPATGTIRVEVVGPPEDELHDASAALVQDAQACRVSGPPPDEDGAFLFREVPLGSYEVVVSKERWRQTAPMTAAIQSAAEVVGVEVRLEPAEG
jgi:hypothetical protein